jgi:hypothetical protein
MDMCDIQSSTKELHMSTIFTAAQGQTITLDLIQEKRPNARFGDLAVVVHPGFQGKPEFFVAKFEGNWAIWEQYGEKSAFHAMLACGGIIQCSDGTLLRAINCETVH